MKKTKTKTKTKTKNKTKAKSIYELLSDIEKRPGLFVGEANLTYVAHFLSGWISHAEWSSPSMSIEEKPNPPFSYFLNYIYMKYTLNDSSGWWQLIVRHCKLNESNALNVFFEELNQFRICRPKTFEKVELVNQKSFERLPGSLFPDQPIPDKIILIGFENSAGAHLYYFKKNILIADLQFRSIRNAKLLLRSTFGNAKKIRYVPMKGDRSSCWKRIEKCIYLNSHHVEYESPFFKWE